MTGQALHSRQVEGAPAKAGQGPVLLVAYDGSPMSEAQVHLACRAANDMGGAVHLLHVLIIPSSVPLHSQMPPHEQTRAEQLLHHAEDIAARYHVRSETHLYYTRSVGEAIIACAQQNDARVIFLGLRDRRRPGTAILISGTLRHVLRHAPCPVQIGYLPAGLPEELAFTTTTP